MTAKIKLNAASGGGSFSLQAPSSSSNNRVISLPDIADGTLVTSQSTLDATKLSGALPALDGSSLTNVGGDYVKLQRATNGGVASELVFDNLDVATYKFFELFLAFVPSADNEKPYFRFRTGGSSGADVNGAHYAFGYRETYPTNTGGDISASGQNEIRLHGNLGYNTGNGEGLRINMRMMFADSSDNGSSAQLSNWITWAASRVDGSDNYRSASGNAIYNENTTTFPTGFKIFMGSGTLNSMSYGLYGLKR